MSHLTSEEVNYLVFRYLQESGFVHSAFTFSKESNVERSRIDPGDVPLGALVTFLQKGLQFHAIECHLRDDGTSVPCTEPVSLVSRHVCSAAASATVPAPPTTSPATEPTPMAVDFVRVRQIPSQLQLQQQQPALPPLPPLTLTSSSGGNNEILESSVTVLRGHASEVFTCAWNPGGSLLASGSGDATARIWEIPHTSSSASIVLRHVPPPQQQQPQPPREGAEKEKSQDVTTLDWNSEGTLLATGSYDGLARVWTSSGALQRVLQRHSGPIFSLKWNTRGDYLLSGSVDKTAVVWEVATGGVVQQFEYHTAPTLDVDWRDDGSFATCSTDRMIYVCEVGKLKPLKQFQGHTDEVNAIKWDPTGSLLASCSDDTTARIWRISDDSCVHNLQGHTKEIYNIKWSPAPKARRGVLPSDLTLASASFDSLVKLWNAETGACIHTLSRHTEAVYSVAFSQNGEFLATGSSDCCLHVWSVRSGALIRTYRGLGGIFDVSWNNTDDKVATCCSNNTICVIDMRM